MITTGFELTEQQQAVIDACAAGDDLVIEAGADTGKTSTLRIAAGYMGARRGMYLGYNRTTADSARAMYPDWVDCVTAHSLAYLAVGFQYASRLRGPATRMPAWAVARQLGIGQALTLGDRRQCSQGGEARRKLPGRTVRRHGHIIGTGDSTSSNPPILSASRPRRLSGQARPRKPRSSRLRSSSCSACRLRSRSRTPPPHAS
jgi:hypothetical protein